MSEAPAEPRVVREKVSFEQFHSENVGFIRKLCRRWRREKDDQDDLEQSMWLRACTKYYQYDPVLGAPTSWLYRIATTEIHTRRLAGEAQSRNAKTISMDAMRDALGKAAESSYLAKALGRAERDDRPATAIENDYARKEWWDLVRCIVDADELEILVLMFHEGLTDVEVAARLSIPLRIARNAVSSARRKLSYREVPYPSQKQP